MKRIITHILLLSIFSQQALAYSPSAEQRELMNDISSVVQEAGVEDLESFINSSEVLNQHDFYQKRSKSIKHLNKMIKKLNKYTDESKISFLVNKKIKQNKKSRRLTKKLLKKKRVVRKLASSLDKTYEQTRELLKSNSSVNIREYRDSLLEKSQKYGNIGNYFKALRTSFKNLSYEKYIEKMNPNGIIDCFGGTESIESDDGLFLVMIIILGFGFGVIALILWVVIIVAGAIGWPATILIGVVTLGGLAAISGV